VGLIAFVGFYTVGVYAYGKNSVWLAVRFDMDPQFFPAPSETVKDHLPHFPEDENLAELRSYHSIISSKVPSSHALALFKYPSYQHWAAFHNSKRQLWDDLLEKFWKNSDTMMLKMSSPTFPIKVRERQAGKGGYVIVAQAEAKAGVDLYSSTYITAMSSILDIPALRAEVIEALHFVAPMSSRVSSLMILEFDDMESIARVLEQEDLWNKITRVTKRYWIHYEWEIFGPSPSYTKPMICAGAKNVRDNY